jgi:hypothetical protein
METQVVEVESVRVSLAKQPDGSKSLVRTPAFATSQPVVDGLIDLGISLWGEAAAPQVTWDGTEGWASYGPGPPDAAFQDAQAAWPAGESCVTTRTALAPHSRLVDLGPPGTLVLLTRSLLSDGPWCAGGATGSYDADLIRLRRVDISMTFAPLAVMLPARASIRRAADRVVMSSVFVRNQR